MSDLRQAAKQALEALNLCRDWPGAYDECSSAIAALRDALARQESDMEEIARRHEKERIMSGIL